ncbi:hypothetical protein BLSTO_01807 [Blastocystis sp. subtype 1]
MNYVDRVLSVVKVCPSMLEGLSWMCFYLAGSIGGLRKQKLSYNVVRLFFHDVYHYSNSEVLDFMQRILQILGCRLLTPCPYSLCFEALKECHHLELYSKAILLIDSVSKRYASISLSASAIVTGVLQVLSQMQFHDLSLLDLFVPPAAVDEHAVRLCVDCILGTDLQLNSGQHP